MIKDHKQILQDLFQDVPIIAPSHLSLFERKHSMAIYSSEMLGFKKDVLPFTGRLRIPLTRDYIFNAISRHDQAESARLQQKMSTRDLVANFFASIAKMEAKSFSQVTTGMRS